MAYRSTRINEGPIHYYDKVTGHATRGPQKSILAAHEYPLRTRHNGTRNEFGQCLPVLPDVDLRNTITPILDTPGLIRYFP